MVHFNEKERWTCEVRKCKKKTDRCGHGSAYFYPAAGSTVPLKFCGAAIPIGRWRRMSRFAPRTESSVCALGTCVPLSDRLGDHHDNGAGGRTACQSRGGPCGMGLFRYAGQPSRTDLSGVFGNVVSALHPGVRHLSGNRSSCGGKGKNRGIFSNPWKTVEKAEKSMRKGAFHA